jgi:ferritin-like metal-binding protein YciE
MKKTAQFEDLFQEWLTDLYDAEKQIVAALPKIVAASSSEELSTVLASYLGESKEQVKRFEDLFEEIAVQPGGRESKPIQALFSECERLISGLEKSAVLDIALIGVLRKVKHYEIAGYSAASEIAEVLGQEDAHDALFETLEEETEADEALAEVAESILGGGEAEEDEIEEEEIEELEHEES